MTLVMGKISYEDKAAALIDTLQFTDLWINNYVLNKYKQEVKVIGQKAPHGGPIPRLGVTPGGRNLYHW